MLGTSIQRDVQTGTFGDDAATVANLNRTIALFEAIGQWPVAFHAEPKAQQMTLLACIGPIAESGPVMQQGMIVDELHITRLKPHAEMQSGIICERVEEIERLDVSRSQSRRVGKALRAIDILALIEPGQEPRIPIQHRDFKIWLFVLRHLASSVRRDRIKQESGKVGTSVKHLVVDCRRTDKERIPSLHRLANA